MAAMMNAATFMGKNFLDNQVTRLFPSVGCARNRLLFRTEQRRGWNSRSWSLGFGYWSVAFFSIQPQKSKENVQRTCAMTHHHINTQRTKLRHNEQQNMRRRLIFLKRELFSNLVRCCTFLNNEAVIKTIIKGKSPTMRHVSRTNRVALDRPYHRINLDSKIQIRYVDTKNPAHRLRHIDKKALSHVKNGRIFSICSISALSAQQAAPKRCRKECNKEQAKVYDCGKVEANVEPCLASCGKLSYSAECACIKSPHSTKAKETCRWRFKSKWRSIRFTCG